MYKLNSGRNCELSEVVRGPECAAAREINRALEGLQEIESSARHVKIDYGKLDEFIVRNSFEAFNLPLWDAPVFRKNISMSYDAVRDAVELLLVGDAINFQFTYLGEDRTEKKYEFEYGGVKWDGAFAMWAALKNASETGVPITDASFLSRMGQEDMTEIFGLKNSMLPMVAERQKIFNEIGNVLIEKYDSSIWNVIEQTRDSEGRARIFNHGKGLVERLVTDFPSFSDTAVYDGKEVTFNKRAQLTAMMAYEKAAGMGLEIFPKEDVNLLTVAANYELPKMLRKLGVIKYSESLARKVDAGIAISHKSEEEIEIRALTIYASKLLVDGINLRRPEELKINALHMDYFLWNAGRKCTDSRHHYTATTAY
ncbi:putative Queuosine, Q, salvage protein family [uncultured archaeon]|nr:putative Queuosine, Q, salvage protein family [uncultured archaeon]